MSQPTSFWTKVTICDDDETSNKYYVMLSQNDYEKYTTDPEYAQKLLRDAKNQAIATTLSQELLNENSQNVSSESDNNEVLGCQDPDYEPEVNEEREANNFNDPSSEGKWSFKATNLLIELVKQNCIGFKCPNVKKVVFWKKIRDLMKQREYNFKVEQVHKKWCNLFGTYKRVKARQLQKQKNGKFKPTRWPYMEVFDSIYKNDPKINQLTDIIKLNGLKNLPPTSFVNQNHEILEKNESMDFSSESSDNNESFLVTENNDKHFAKELQKIRVLLSEKSEREEEALNVLKDLAKTSIEQEDRRTRAIETLTNCVTQLTEAIKTLVEKQ